MSLNSVYQDLVKDKFKDKIISCCNNLSESNTILEMLNSGSNNLNYLNNDDISNLINHLDKQVNSLKVKWFNNQNTPSVAVLSTSKNFNLDCNSLRDKIDIIDLFYDNLRSMITHLTCLNIPLIFDDSYEGSFTLKINSIDVDFIPENIDEFNNIDFKFNNPFFVDKFNELKELVNNLTKTNQDIFFTLVNIATYGIPFIRSSNLKSNN